MYACPQQVANFHNERTRNMAKTTRTALVVDDEAVARDFIRAILESIDWKVIEAADGQLPSRLQPNKSRN